MAELAFELVLLKFNVKPPPLVGDVPPEKGFYYWAGLLLV